MKKTLHLKFVLAYLVFGLLAFLAVSTVSSRMTYRYLIRKEADALYTEVNTLASQCSERYSGKDINMTIPFAWRIYLLSALLCCRKIR